MTRGQLIKATTENDYVLVRYYDGAVIGFNCKAQKIALKRHNGDLNQETNIISYRQCSFHEYISHKTPFM